MERLFLATFLIVHCYFFVNWFLLLALPRNQFVCRIVARNNQRDWRRKRRSKEETSGPEACGRRISKIESYKFTADTQSSSVSTRPVYSEVPTADTLARRGWEWGHVGVLSGVGCRGSGMGWRQGRVGVSLWVQNPMYILSQSLKRALHDQGRT